MTRMTPSTTYSVEHVDYVNDETLVQIWDDMGAKQKVVFYDRSVLNASEFVATARSNTVSMFIVRCGDQRAAVIWFNGFEGYSARVHYIVFKQFYRRSTGLLRWAAREFFQIQRVDGTPFLTVMVGVTPVTNRLAVKMMERVGFNALGEIPDCCYDSRTGRNIAGIVSYLHVEDIIHG